MLTRMTNLMLCVAILLGGALPLQAESAQPTDVKRDAAEGSDRMKYLLVAIPCFVPPDGPMPQTHLAAVGDPAGELWGWCETFVEWIPNALAGSTAVVRGRLHVETRDRDGNPTVTEYDFVREIPIPGPAPIILVFFLEA